MAEHEGHESSFESDLGELLSAIKRLQEMYAHPLGGATKHPGEKFGENPGNPATLRSATNTERRT
jgi:hypothetical protein